MYKIILAPQKSSQPPSLILKEQLICAICERMLLNVGYSRKKLEMLVSHILLRKKIQSMNGVDLGPLYILVLHSICEVMIITCYILNRGSQQLKNSVGVHFFKAKFCPSFRM
jgi:hypothetical protein